MRGPRSSTIHDYVTSIRIVRQTDPHGCLREPFGYRLRPPPTLFLYLTSVRRTRPAVPHQRVWFERSLKLSE
jgi:hypothetical protein